MNSRINLQLIQELHIRSINGKLTQKVKDLETEKFLCVEKIKKLAVENLELQKQDAHLKEHNDHLIQEIDANNKQIILYKERLEQFKAQLDETLKELNNEREKAIEVEETRNKIIAELEVEERHLKEAEGARIWILLRTCCAAIFGLGIGLYFNKAGEGAAKGAGIGAILQHMWMESANREYDNYHAKVNQLRKKLGLPKS